MYALVIIAALAIGINAVPCPFNQVDCTCTSEAIDTHVDTANCAFKTGNTPSFPTLYNKRVSGFSINHVNAMSLPDNTFQNIPALSSLRVLANTTITTIEPKAFAGLKNLNTLTFERFTDANLNAMRKPLADLPALNQFNLNRPGVAFKVVDWADFSESTSRDIDVNVKKIDLVTATPTAKFAVDFEFKGPNAEIDNIDQSVGVNLKKYNKSRLLIQSAKLGACTNFNWMTTIRCPGQNSISGTTCLKDGARVSLSQHLKTVDPNTTCK